MRFLLALFLTGSLMATDPWTKPQVAMEVGYQAALLCDWLQTSRMHRTWNPRPGSYEVVERNPLLGHYPSQAAVNRACLISALGHVAISSVLPSRWRTWWQGATLAVEVGIVANNQRYAQIALRF